MKKLVRIPKPSSEFKGHLSQEKPGFWRHGAKEETSPQAVLPDFRPLDKESYEPLYAQIQAQLREHIRSGRLGVNELLPGESELSRIFGVSRMTSRQALQELTNDGLTYRERGRGTFVSPQKVEKHIAHLQGFSAEMRLLGLRASTQVLAVGLVPASEAIARELAVPPGSNVLHLQRVRSANDEPIVIEDVWVPHLRFPGIEKIDFSKKSLYESFRERYGIKIGSAREVIEARGATRQEAQLLSVAVKSSLLVVSRTLLDADARPIETAHSLYRGDRYRAVLSIPAVDPFPYEVKQFGLEQESNRRALPI